MRQLLEKLEGKQILFFSTAGFGQTKEYFEQISAGVERLVREKNKVLGSFFCQGRMPDEIRMRYEKAIQKNPKDEKAKLFLNNFDFAKCHPNAEDLKRLLDFASARVMAESSGRSKYV